MAYESEPFDSDYIDVATRIVDARQRYPEGVLQPLDPAAPYKIETIGGKTFVVYCAAFYRTPHDVRPGVGTAWEPFPGVTDYTRDSELQNAETAAWGRALIAAFAADATRGIATSSDIRNREAERRERFGQPGQRQWAAPAPSPAAERPARDVGDEPMTPALHARLSAQFATLGVAGRDESVMVIGALAEVQVSAVSELTTAQAQKVIQALEPLAKAEDPAAALAAALRQAMAGEESHDDAA